MLSLDDVRLTRVRRRQWYPQITKKNAKLELLSYVRINSAGGRMYLGGISPFKWSQQMIQNIVQTRISSQIITMYGEWTLENPYRLATSVVCLMAVPSTRQSHSTGCRVLIVLHVVRNPKPRVNPQAIDAMTRSARVTTSGLKSSESKVIMISDTRAWREKKQIEHLLLWHQDRMNKTRVMQIGTVSETRMTRRFVPSAISGSFTYVCAFELLQASIPRTTASHVASCITVVQRLVQASQWPSKLRREINAGSGNFKHHPNIPTLDMVSRASRNFLNGARGQNQKRANDFLWKRWQ